MEVFFKRSSIEKFLAAFIHYGKTELPQHKIVELVGGGAYYQAIEYLKQKGLVEETRCYSEEKRMEVKCVKLTERGKQVLEHLKRIREIVLSP